MPRGPFRNLQEGEMPLNMERGGAVCNHDDTGRTAHMLMGSGKPGACMETLGSDPRPRWRDAEGIKSGSQLVSRRASRHSSYAEMQSRGAAGSARRAAADEK